jgi:hypothetical protein
MEAIDRGATEFRALQEAVLARLSGLDLTAVSNLIAYIGRSDSAGP